MDRNLTPTEARIVEVLAAHGGYASYDTLGWEALGMAVPYRVGDALTAHGANLRAKGVNIHSLWGLGLEDRDDQRAPRPERLRHEKELARVEVACPECGTANLLLASDLRRRQKQVEQNGRSGVYGFCDRACRARWFSRRMEAG